MRGILFIVIAVVMIVSCGPSRHAIYVEMRHPSKSGLELTGKILSAVYYSGEDSLENRTVDSLVTGFARALEVDYLTGEGSVRVSRIARSDGDYTSRDSLINLVVRTGGDVVFLFDVTLSRNLTAGGRPVMVEMYCYDGMGNEDIARRIVGNTLLAASTQEELLSEASKAGRTIAESFKAQWKHEQYTIAYYDSARWIEALVRAEQFDWKGAMDIWFEFLDSPDPLKRASAEYNIAVACYMMGDFELAKLWLDRSDAENKMPTLSDAMRKRLQKK